MTAPLRLESGEYTVEQILDALESGRRILLTIELLGSPQEISLRYDGDIYYCDTPTRLHKHREKAEMHACIERMGYGRSEDGST